MSSGFWVATIMNGASPRASLQLVRAAKAWAAMQGRDYVIPDDLQALVGHAFGHRLLLTAEAHMSGRGAGDVLASIVGSIAIPATVSPETVPSANGTAG